MIAKRLIRGRLFIVIFSFCFFRISFSTAVAETPVIRNTEAKLPPSTIELEEIWSVGGEDSEFVFGLVIDSLSDEDGNVYLLDNQLCQIEVFDVEGEHVRTLSRQGDGPGEIRVPIAIEWLPDGSLGILELFPSEFVKIDRDGTPAGNTTILIGDDSQTGFTASISSACRNGVIISSGQRGTPSETGQARLQYLSRFDREGHELVRYCEANAVLSFAPPLFDEVSLLPPFFFASAVGPGERIYAAEERNAYSITVFEADGTPLRVIEREFENWNRNDRDNRRMNAMVDAWFQRVPGDVERRLASCEQTIQDIFVAEDGNLWVQHSRSGRDQAAGVLLTYDTFDSEGQYLQEISVRCEGDSAYDGLRFLPDGRVLIIKGYVLARWAATGAQNVTFGEEDNDAPMEIICCRVKDFDR